MAYLSELVRREVRDHRGNILGHLTDLVIAPEDSNNYPRVVALLLSEADYGEPAHRTREKPVLIRWTGNEDLAGNKIILQQPPQPYQENGNEIYLARDLLDKQVIDTDNHRMVRVNDLELGKIGTD